MDIKLTDSFDLFLDEDGNFVYNSNNSIPVAIGTDALEINADFKSRGFVNSENLDYGSQLWQIVLQSAMTPQTRSLIKNDISTAILPYGIADSTIINTNTDGGFFISVDVRGVNYEFTVK